MVDLSDLRLDRPDAPEPQPGTEQDRRTGRLTAAALIVLLLLTAAAVYLGWFRRALPPAPSRGVQSRSGAARPLPVEPPAAIVLPPLDETDSIVRQLVTELSSHPKVIAWLATDGLIRNFAVVIQNIADHH